MATTEKIKRVETKKNREPLVDFFLKRFPSLYLYKVIWDIANQLKYPIDDNDALFRQLKAPSFTLNGRLTIENILFGATDFPISTKKNAIEKMAANLEKNIFEQPPAVLQTVPQSSTLRKLGDLPNGMGIGNPKPGMTGSTCTSWCYRRHNLKMHSLMEEHLGGMDHGDYMDAVFKELDRLQACLKNCRRNDLIDSLKDPVVREN